MLHPSSLGKLKQSVAKELRKKVNTWDHERQGVLTSYTGKKQILNGGKGRVTDTCAYIRIVVRYTAVFARPQIDAMIKGKITSIASTSERVSVVCQIEGGLDTIISSVDTTKFALKQEE